MLLRDSCSKSGDITQDGRGTERKTRWWFLPSLPPGPSPALLLLDPYKKKTVRTNLLVLLFLLLVGGSSSVDLGLDHLRRRFSFRLGRHSPFE